MTLDEARQNIGAVVLYFGDGRGDPPGNPPTDQGVIMSVNDTYVFVRYGTDVGSQATYPRNLTLARITT